MAFIVGRNVKSRGANAVVGTTSLNSATFTFIADVVNITLDPALDPTQQILHWAQLHLVTPSGLAVYYEFRLRETNSGLVLASARSNSFDYGFNADNFISFHGQVAPLSYVSPGGNWHVVLEGVNDGVNAITIGVSDSSSDAASRTGWFHAY